MFSRFIRPDAVRVETTGAPSDTLVAAFKNEAGSTVVVMINNGSGSQDVSVKASGCHPTAYYMDNSVSSPTELAVQVKNGNVVASLPGHSVVTFVL